MSINGVKISENFLLREFACKDGSNQVILDNELLLKVQKLREIVKIPFSPNSAYRNFEYNKKIGGSPRSQHLLGRAVDVPELKGFNSTELALLAAKLGFRGIGVYDTFCHMDTRTNPSGKFSYWDYRSASSSNKKELQSHIEKVWGLWS